MECCDRWVYLQDRYIERCFRNRVAALPKEGDLALAKGVTMSGTISRQEKLPLSPQRWHRLTDPSSVECSLRGLEAARALARHLISARTRAGARARGGAGGVPWPLSGEGNVLGHTPLTHIYIPWYIYLVYIYIYIYPASTTTATDGEGAAVYGDTIGTPMFHRPLRGSAVTRAKAGAALFGKELLE